MSTIRGTKIVTSCLPVIKSGKATSGGNWHALVSGRSIWIVIKVRLRICVTGAGMHWTLSAARLVYQRSEEVH